MVIFGVVSEMVHHRMLLSSELVIKHFSLTMGQEESGTTITIGI